MKVNFFKNTFVQSVDFVYYLILGFVFTLSLIFLAWQLNAFFQDMNDIDFQNYTLIYPSEEEKNFSLFVEKLNLQNIPIILDVDGSNEEEYFQALEKGLAHYKGTAYPGKKGNSFIFGHSEYYWDKPGDYKQIFKNLDLLEVGDKIIIRSEKREYRYLVLETKIVSPNNVEVLEQSEDYHLTLMTCWPPGSTAKRLIVVAQRTN